MSEASSPGKKAVATRLRILDAAASQFRMNGYAGTRLSDVAVAAKTRTGSLYYHFGSREELVEAVLRVGHERSTGHVRRRVAALPADATPLDRLREAMSAHLASVLDIGDYTAASLRILAQVPEPIRHRALHEQREYGQYWHGLIGDARAAGQIRSDLSTVVVLRFIMGAMNSTSEWFRPRTGGLTVAQVQEQLELIFLEGLAASPSPRATPMGLLAGTGVDGPRVTAAGLEMSVARRRVLDAAATVFREKGYSATRLADIAARADVGISALYHHFSSREDLVNQLVLSAWSQTDGLVRERIRTMPAGTSATERLAVAVTAHMWSVLQPTAHTSALVRIVGQVPAAVRSATVVQQRNYLHFWRQLVGETVLSGEIRAAAAPSVVAMMIIGALNWSVDWYGDQDIDEARNIVSEFVTLIFDGLIVG